MAKEKNILDVLADQQWNHADSVVQSVDIAFPWPPANLRVLIEEERSNTDDPGELEDLESASICLSVVEQAIDENDPLVAAEFGIQIGQYLARYEMRSKRRFFTRGKKAIEASAAGGKKGSTTTNADHKELHARYQTEVDSLMASGVSYEKATLAVADSLVVSQAVVKLRTKNPKSLNRGGNKR